MKGKNRMYCLGLLLVGILCFSDTSAKVKGQAYYVSVHGNDSDPGTLQKPWRTIAKLNSAKIGPGDSLLLEGGQTFEGTLRLGAAETGSSEMSIYIGSYGKGKSTIDAGQGEAIMLYNTSYIEIRNLNLKGSGIAGNITNGLAVMFSENIFIDSIKISGFQKSGLLIFSSRYVIAQHVYAAENGFAGISVDGEFQEYNSHDIILRSCIAENNSGITGRQSGHGISAGSCRKVTIEYCVAVGNGSELQDSASNPVGIRTFESDSVLIQYCIAYRNKASLAATGGGGYSLDGGVKNSTIRNCLSYGNEGSGYGIFQFDTASYWYNNTISNCTSENDGLVSTKAGIYIRANVSETNQFHNLYFRNNTIYNDSVAAIKYEPNSLHAAFYFSANIIVSKSNLVQNWETTHESSQFICNNWWSPAGKFNIDGQRDFAEWSTRYEEEMQGMNMAGTNIDPAFLAPGKTTLTDPHALKNYSAYRTPLTWEGLGSLYKAY